MLFRKALDKQGHVRMFKQQYDSAEENIQRDFIVSSVHKPRLLRQIWCVTFLLLIFYILDLIMYVDQLPFYHLKGLTFMSGVIC